MELVLLVAVVLSAAINIYLAKMVTTVVNVSVPAPEVHVTVEAPEAVELQAIESVGCDHTVLEAILARLVELHPVMIPTYVPQYPQPPYYPMVGSDQVTSEPTDNVITINGVPGRQFPARGTNDRRNESE